MRNKTAALRSGAIIDERDLCFAIAVEGIEVNRASIHLDAGARNSFVQGRADLLMEGSQHRHALSQNRRRHDGFDLAAIEASNSFSAVAVCFSSSGAR